ncbi:P-loop containing nucleoside triphosphate hydrolase protein [Zopfochytrium polystomum]|nr:P-loop containing nucleoside triphosphate hydrolase protein [Zopfochytrium polystomum]
MIALAVLSEESILKNLRNRFAARLIYTYVGTILVAVNPFEQIDIYNTSIAKKYAKKALSANPPHIFGIAEEAFNSMKITSTGQSIIISGESGAGKSESTKYILSYLTCVSGEAGEHAWIQQQILEANTVLESFGNAKTVRNNNSSRYGKFVQVYFNTKFEMEGAAIQSFLLEKSRISKQAPNERNYHVFYELLAGANEIERAKYLLLDGPDKYKFLSQSSCLEIPGVSDKSLFEGLKLAFTVLNMKEPMLDGIFRMLSAVLWLGNVAFREDSGQESVQLSSAEEVRNISTLLGIDQSKLTEALRTRKLTILSFINSSLVPKEKRNVIGVLDIFGFEGTTTDFKTNSFEQLCINYTNEKLQQYFNQYIFKLEQEERLHVLRGKYRKEGIAWQTIEFLDNLECLELIEVKPIGILALLDEEAKVPKGSDESWLEKLNKQHEKHKFFVKPKAKTGTFGIRHYAGEVFYTACGFLEKNKDAVQEGILELLQSSTIPGVSALCEKPDSSTAPKEKSAVKQTAGGIFRSQLASLVAILNSTPCHYVRCIKPNMEKTALLMDDEKVLMQLRYSGMLETIKIRKTGFSSRITIESFIKSYKILCMQKKEEKASDLEIATEIVNNVGIDSEAWRCGRTKLFFHGGVLEKIHQRAEEVIATKVACLQSLVRSRAARKKFLKKKASTIIIQRRLRVFLEQSRFRRRQKAIIVIQSVVRGWFARDYVKTLRQQRLKELQAQEEAALAAAATEKPPEEISAEKAASLESLAELAKQGEELKQLEEEVQQLKTPVANKSEIDQIFSFLDDFAGSTEINAIAANITSEIDEIAKKDQAGGNGGRNLPELPPKRPSEEALPTPRPLKDNPLTKKEMDSNEKLAMDPYSGDLFIDSFLAKNAERDSVQGQKYKRPPNLAEILSFTKVTITKHPITHSITKLQKSEDLTILALDSFKMLLKMLDPGYKRLDEAHLIVQSWINLGIDHIHLRDELFVQIIKQMTWSKDNVANACSCDKVLSTVKVVEENLVKYPVFAETAMRKTALNGARHFPPTIQEIQALEEGVDRMTQSFFIVDGSSFELQITPVTTAGDVVKEIAAKISLLDPSGWFLFEECANSTSSNSDFASSENDGLHKRYCCELGKRRNKSDSKLLKVFVQTISKEAGWQPDERQRYEIAAVFESPAETRLVMRKRVFKAPRDAILDPVEHNLLYHQAKDAVAKDLLPLTEREAVQLAALRAQAEMGDCDMTHATSVLQVSMNHAQEWICPRIFKMRSKDQLVTTIANQYATFRGMTQLKAKFLYLEIARSNNFYGASLFRVEYKGFWTFGQFVWLAVSKQGIELALEEKKDVFMVFGCASVLSFEASDDTLELSIERHSPQHEEADDFEMQKKKKLGDLDQSALEKDLEKARNALLEKGIVRTPGPAATEGMITSGVQDTKTIKGSLIMKAKRSSILRRSGSFSRRNSKRGSLSGWDQYEYTEADWSYSGSKLLTSLTVSEETPGLEDFAIHLHNGNLVSKFGSTDFNLGVRVQTFAPQIQDIIASCLTHPRYTNELYLQLVKMTTKHVEPDSSECLNYWTLLAIATGALAPPSLLVLDYLKAHLRRCSALGLRNKKVMERQSKFAKYSLSTLLRTAATVTDPRKNPPSTDEIIFASGKMMRILTNVPSEEVPLYAEDKFSDVLYACERTASDILSTSGVSFVLKKRLFFDSAQVPGANVDEEDDLVLAQLFEDVRNDLFPISLDDAIYSAALHAQWSYGDAKIANLNYEKIAARLIPKRFGSPDNALLVQKRHNELAGRSIKEVKTVLLDFFKSRPLYGTTIFNAMQNYTNQIPCVCWLGVSIKGIHIMAKFANAPLISHPFNELISFRPGVNCILIVAENASGTTKYVLTTEQSFIIAALISDYRDLQSSF